MTEEQMADALRKLGYTIRPKVTGYYIVRYSCKKSWSATKETMKYAVRRTRFRGQSYDGKIPKSAEIAEIDPDMLKWESFWPAEATKRDKKECE